MPTCVTPAAASQSRKTSRSRVTVRNVRTSLVGRSPGAPIRRHSLRRWHLVAGLASPRCIVATNIAVHQIAERVRMRAAKHDCHDRPEIEPGSAIREPVFQQDAAARSLRPLHLVVRETEFCGLRLAGYFRRRMRENSRNSVRRPRCASLTRRNYGGFCLPGNRPGLSGLHGGGCRNRTDGHRSLASLQNEAARRGFSARNDLSQRMSKSLAGKPKALTINRYLPVSLRFHSLSSRSTAMVVTCSRALRRLQE